VEESVRMTADRDKWRKYAYGVATLRSKTAKEQDRLLRHTAAQLISKHESNISSQKCLKFSKAINHRHKTSPPLLPSGESL